MATPVRTSSRRQRRGVQTRPGLYAEPEMEQFEPAKPLYRHPTPEFRADLVPHCAFPSMPLDHPGLGPSEAYKLAHPRPPVEWRDAAEEADDEMDTDLEDGEDDTLDVGEKMRGRRTSVRSCNDRSRYNIVNRNAARRRDLVGREYNSDFESEREHDYDVVYVDHVGGSGSHASSSESCSCDSCQRMSISARFVGRLVVEVVEKPNIGQDGDSITQTSDTSPQSGPTDSNNHYEVNIIRRPKTPKLLGYNGRLPALEVLCQIYAKKDRHAKMAQVPFPKYEKSPEFTIPSILDGDYVARPSNDEDGDVSVPRTAPKQEGPGYVQPDWPNLSKAMKYIIVYELTEKGLSFVNAIRTLGLSLSESAELVEIIAGETDKIKIINREAVSPPLDRTEGTQLWLDNLPHIEWPQLITDSITRDEVVLASEYLNFMGFDDIAAHLHTYEGVGTRAYPVSLNHYWNDGPRCLLPHFNVGCRHEIREMVKWLNDGRKKILGRERFLRMYAPPGTVDPLHLCVPDSEKTEQLRQEGEARSDGEVLESQAELGIPRNGESSDVRNESSAVQQGEQSIAQPVEWSVAQNGEAFAAPGWPSVWAWDNPDLMALPLDQPSTVGTTYGDLLTNFKVSDFFEISDDEIPYRVEDWASLPDLIDPNIPIPSVEVDTEPQSDTTIPDYFALNEASICAKGVGFSILHDAQGHPILLDACSDTELVEAALHRTPPPNIRDIYNIRDDNTPNFTNWPIEAIRGYYYQKYPTPDITGWPAEEVKSYWDKKRPKKYWVSGIPQQEAREVPQEAEKGNLQEDGGNSSDSWGWMELDFDGWPPEKIADFWRRWDEDCEPRDWDNLNAQKSPEPEMPRELTRIPPPKPLSPTLVARVEKAIATAYELIGLDSEGAEQKKGREEPEKPDLDSDATIEEKVNREAELNDGEWAPRPRRKKTAPADTGRSVPPRSAERKWPVEKAARKKQLARTPTTRGTQTEEESEQPRSTIVVRTRGYPKISVTSTATTESNNNALSTSEKPHFESYSFEPQLELASSLPELHPRSWEPPSKKFDTMHPTKKNHDDENKYDNDNSAIIMSNPLYTSAAFAPPHTGPTQEAVPKPKAGRKPRAQKSDKTTRAPKVVTVAVPTVTNSAQPTDVPVPAKRGRGRPPAAAPPVVAPPNTETAQPVDPPVPVKRGRGRPRKNPKIVIPAPSNVSVTVAPPTPVPDFSQAANNVPFILPKPPAAAQTKLDYFSSTLSLSRGLIVQETVPAHHKWIAEANEKYGNAYIATLLGDTPTANASLSTKKAFSLLPEAPTGLDDPFTAAPSIPVLTGAKTVKLLSAPGPRTEFEVEVLLEDKGLLEKFEALKKDGENTLDAVARLEKQFCLPLELFSTKHLAPPRKRQRSTAPSSSGKQPKKKRLTKEQERQAAEDKHIDELVKANGHIKLVNWTGLGSSVPLVSERLEDPMNGSWGGIGGKGKKGKVGVYIGGLKVEEHMEEEVLKAARGRGGKDHGLLMKVLREAREREERERVVVAAAAAKEEEMGGDDEEMGGEEAAVVTAEEMAAVGTGEKEDEDEEMCEGEEQVGRDEDVDA